jgi:subtilase family serine protease
MSQRRPRRYRPTVEALDDRCLLAATGLTPAQITSAYGLSGQNFNAQAADGTGQTIAIVDAYNDPNIAAELSTFDSTYNLPAPPSLIVVGQTGTSALPRTDAGWAGEEAMDVEWAHAIAPGASLILVETDSSEMPDLTAGVKTAASLAGVSVVSMSWGGPEFHYVTNYDRIFTAGGVTFVASGGDGGRSSGAQWPASSGLVVGVGGTTLQVGAGGAYVGETAWAGSSGGYSTIETEPSYQSTVQSSGFRSTPDVAFDGDTATGVSVYAIDPGNGQGAWITAGGTSLGAPAWAAIMAIVDQGRALSGAGTLGSFQTLTALYSLPASDFHVIGGGYRPSTGLGSPNGRSLITDLVGVSVGSGTSSPPSTPSPTPTPTPTPSPTATPTSPPVNNWPVINTPVSNPPVTSTGAPVTSQPVGTMPVTSLQNLTPPAAAPPMSVRKAGKKKPVRKHPHVVTKTIHHPKPHTAGTGTSVV